MSKHELSQSKDITVQQHHPQVLRLTPIDRRRAERLALTLEMSYIITTPEDQLSGHTHTMNISGIGVMFHSLKMVSPPSSCQITLTLPKDYRPVVMPGQVVWCRKLTRKHPELYEVAIEFEVSSRDDADFTRYCHFIATEVLKRHLH